MLGEIDRRESDRARRKQRGRAALTIDMLKSYAGPVILAAFLNPILQGGAGTMKLGVFNYVLLVIGMAMIGLALIYAPEKG